MTRSVLPSRRAACVHESLPTLINDTPGENVLERVAAVVGSVVPFDGAFLAAADPATMLCMRRGLVHNLDPSLCQDWWDNEYLVADFNKYADIARSPVGALTLHDATGYRPERSERFRRILRPMGYRAELRFACTNADGTWGFGCLLRDRHRAEFTTEEVGFMADASSAIATGLQRILTADAPIGHGDGSDGAVVIFDAADHQLTATAAGSALLAEVIDDDSPRREMPFEVRQLLSHARAIAAGRVAATAARTRLRTGRGRWLALEASPLRDEHGSTTSTALLLRPLGADELAPLLAAGYQLSPRERQITALVARGLTTGEIAADLFISAHTVRDHLKAIFTKVGVTSRGELVARLFATTYLTDLHAGLTHPDDLDDR